MQDSQASGDWGERASCGIAIVHAQYPDAKPRVGEIRTNSDGNLISTGTARVFHPKPQGYKAIVEEIRSLWPYIPSEFGVSEPELVTHCTEAVNREGPFEVPMGHVAGFCHHDFSLDED